MNRQIGYLIIALLATTLFFLAVGYDGWGCGGSILGENCIKITRLEEVGAILLTAGFCLLVTSIFLILVLALGASWADIVSAVFATLGAILGIAGVFHYYSTLSTWSPFIATIAMTFAVALAAVLLFDLISEYTG